MYLTNSSFTFWNFWNPRHHPLPRPLNIVDTQLVESSDVESEDMESLPALVLT